MSKDSKILVVGGLGYVGGRFAHYLASQDYAELAISTTRDKHPDWAEQFEMGKLDLGSEASIRECLTQIQPDIVIHLGAMQQAQCQADPVAASKINEAGMDSLLYVAHDMGVKRCIYLSSFQVYGDFVGDITERTPTRPKSVYAETKLRGEDVVRHFRNKGLDVRTIRLSNAYGYPMDNQVADSVWTLAVNAFCRKVVRDRSLTVKSNQFRDFVTMFDAVRGIEHVMNLPEDQSGDGLFNLGGENCLSIREIAERVVRIYAELAPETEVAVEGPTEDLDKVFEPFNYNISRIKESGFALQGDMDQAIRMTLQFCLENDQSSVA